MTDRFDHLRAEYAGGGLDGPLPDTPGELLARWLDEAAAIPLANAMALATASAAGEPSVRMVLLKGIDNDGRLHFVTSYESPKAADLEQNPRAALLFFWQPLHRQIRVTGAVARLSESQSDTYFAARPRESNLSAMASRQSAALPGGPAQLAAERDALAREWDGRELERPADWGGYGLAPESFEFWQGKENRLHDRLGYTLEAGSWRRQWLYP
jgi:pyridoxamine-phosphate oxidase